MVGTLISFRGLGRAQRRMKNAQLTPAKIQAALFQGALFLEGETKESIAGHRAEPTSVDTGRFMSSVKSKTVDNESVEVYSDVDYAQYLEFGTSKMSARSHFRNSADRNEGQVVKIVKKKLLGGVL